MKSSLLSLVVLGAPVAHRVVPGHAEAVGDDMDAQVPGKAAVAALVQHRQGHEQDAGESSKYVTNADMTLYMISSKIVF